MEILLGNFEYILFNSFLAIFALVLAYLMVKTHYFPFKIFYGFLWLIFLPNTIYILTDLIHFFRQWPEVDTLLFKFLLFIQYAVFMLVGVFTFIFALYFFEKLFEKKSAKKSRKAMLNKKGTSPTSQAIIFALNFLVGFGAIMGGVQRTNSWYIFTQPLRVFNDVMQTLGSRELVILSIAFGLLGNLIYFFFSKPVTQWGSKYLKRL